MHPPELPVSSVLRLLSVVLLAAIPVTQALAANCSVSVDSVDFGTYEPMSRSNLNGAGKIRADCRGGAATVVIRLAPGRSGVATNRYMTSGTDPLYYNLFTNASRTVIWGDGSAGTSLVSRSKGKGRRRFEFMVYGRIFASQDAVPGFYTDDIVVTVTF